MLVIAAPGLQVPKEENPRDYITDDTAVEVGESAYYLRRVTEGDLIITPTAADTSKKTKGAE